MSKKPVIVAVDDMKVVRILVKQILTDAGFDVILGEDGQQGVELARKHNPDLIISDVEMPIMNGHEFCKAVKEDPVLRKIYFIHLSTLDTTDNKVEGLNIGADDYISKETPPTELIARVRAGLRIRNLQKKLDLAYNKLLQSEKMAAVGQLAAGVAHEINNPTGFIHSNLHTLKDYIKDVLKIVTAYEGLITNLKQEGGNLSAIVQQTLTEVEVLREKIDLDFIIEDMGDLLSESYDGTDRIKKIVADLKIFTQLGEEMMEDVDINQCLDSSLNITCNELKYKAEVTKNYQNDLPKIKGYPHKLSQSFMNILINSGQAIVKNGKIVVATRQHNNTVRILFSDNGKGIAKENIRKIFDPFFTTNEVGAGTGLGLHVAYTIISDHGGTIEAKSLEGKGTVISITLPIDSSNS